MREPGANINFESISISYIDKCDRCDSYESGSGWPGLIQNIFNGDQLIFTTIFHTGKIFHKAEGLTVHVVCLLIVSKQRIQ